MNPTVSENIILFPSIFTTLLDVERVVNNSIPTNFDSPVKRLNKVVLPTEVYPIIDAVGKPDLALLVLCKSFLFSSRRSFFLRTDILLFISNKCTSASYFPNPKKLLVLRFLNAADFQQQYSCRPRSKLPSELCLLQ